MSLLFLGFFIFEGNQSKSDEPHQRVMSAINESIKKIHRSSHNFRKSQKNWAKKRINTENFQ